MNFKGHLLGSILAFCITLVLLLQVNSRIDNIIPLEASHFLFYALVFVYFGLMPDLDTDSKIENHTYRAILLLLFVLIVAEEYYYASLIGMFSCIPKITTHRERKFPWSLVGMHGYPIGITLSVVIGLYLGVAYGVFAFMGFMTHLFLDSGFVRELRGKQK